jgi:hypothetical protein
MALRQPPFQYFEEMCSSYRLSCLQVERSGLLSPAQAIEVGMFLGLDTFDQTWVAFQYDLEFRIQHLDGPGYSERWSLSGWVLDWIPPGSVTIDGFELEYGVGNPDSVFNSASEAIRSSDWFSDSNDSEPSFSYLEGYNSDDTGDLGVYFDGDGVLRINQNQLEDEASDHSGGLGDNLESDLETHSDGSDGQ